MVQSKAVTVDAYIAEAPPERRSALTRLRDLARVELPDHDERMAYDMPAYFRDDLSDFAFASQKQHLAIYVTKTDVHAKNADALAGLDCGKGCIRYRKPDAIDFDLVAKLLADTRESGETPCK